MHESKCGHQTIACDVRSCIHNGWSEIADGMTEGFCRLPRIHVAPKCGCNTCSPEESLCETYKARS